MQTDELVLGIDGGGTKTVACLARGAPVGERSVLGRGLAGASNPQAVGFARATANLDLAVAAAFDDAGLARQPVRVAVLALAGSDRDASRRALVEWAEDNRLARSLRVVHDALPVLAAGCPAQWGIALISGTGSFAYGQTVDGRATRAGGWGFLFGDEGSGYALGLAGLRAVAQSADGRGPATNLADALVAELGAKGPEGLVPAVYQAADRRAVVAGLAAAVLATAADGDAVAERIVGDATAELARMVAAVAEKLALAGAAFPLALAGSTLLRSPRFKALLLDRIAAAGLHADPVADVTDPVCGTVKLAQSEALG